MVCCSYRERTGCPQCTGLSLLLSSKRKPRQALSVTEKYGLHNVEIGLVIHSTSLGVHCNLPKPSRGQLWTKFFWDTENQAAAAGEQARKVKTEVLTYASCVCGVLSLLLAVGPDPLATFENSQLQCINSLRKCPRSTA